jgi:hypothetical protein
MIGMVEKSVAEKEKLNDSLIEECLQHIRFCQSKCEGFSGREETLEVTCIGFFPAQFSRTNDRFIMTHYNS